MMKGLFILLSIVLFFSRCSLNKVTAWQKNNAYLEKYDAFLEEDETKTFAWYQGVYSQNKKGNYIERLFYPEKNQITHLTTYKSKRKYIKHGSHQRWFDNGSKMSEGAYSNGNKNGLWKHYHYGDNKVRVEGNYKNGVADGLWKYYDVDGNIMVELTYKDGLREGEFVEYDTDGSVLNKGMYKSDAIFSQLLEDEIYTPSDDTILELVEAFPYLVGCEEGSSPEERKKCSDSLLLKTIYEQINYPTFAVENATEGNALINFTIYEDGTINDIVVYSGVCESIEKECLRVIALLPKWNPGRVEGKAVKVEHNLPIRFKLN